MSYYNVLLRRNVSVLPSLPDVSNPGWAEYQARGWRKVDPVPAPPQGSRIVVESYEQDGVREDYVNVVYRTIPIPTPPTTIEDEVAAIMNRMDSVEKDVKKLMEASR